MPDGPGGTGRSVPGMGAPGRGALGEPSSSGIDGIVGRRVDRDRDRPAEGAPRGPVRVALAARTSAAPRPGCEKDRHGLRTSGRTRRRWAPPGSARRDPRRSRAAPRGLSGLSQTTTRLGVLDEARTRPQAPLSSITRAPLTVTTSAIARPPSAPPSSRAGLDPPHDARQRVVLLAVRAEGRHGGRVVDGGQGAPHVRDRPLRVAVEDPAQLDGHAHPVVVAPPDGLGEEVVARLLEPRERAQLVDAALHVGVAGLPSSRPWLRPPAARGRRRRGRWTFTSATKVAPGCSLTRSRAMMTPTLSAKISSPSSSTTPQRSPSPSKPSARSAPDAFTAAAMSWSISIASGLGL